MGFPDIFNFFPVLETERVTLRKITLADAEDFFGYYSNPQVTKYLDWRGPSTIEEAQEVIQAWNNNYEQKMIIPWGIALKHSDRLIGTIPFIPIRGTFESTPLFPTAVGFELSQQYWNTGIMSEALHAVIDFGFNQMGSHRIQAEVYPENTPSLRLLKKAGFQEEGTLRKYLYHEENKVFNDIILLSLLKDSSRPS
jgi:ribosomal-protein-alanine N-acetyltransferase